MIADSNVPNLEDETHEVMFIIRVKTLKAGERNIWARWSAHLLQHRVGAGAERVEGQEEQQRWAFIQLPLQEARLCSRRLQPPEDVLVVLKHPVADGF